MYYINLFGFVVRDHKTITIIFFPKLIFSTLNRKEGFRRALLVLVIMYTYFHYGKITPRVDSGFSEP